MTKTRLRKLALLLSQIKWVSPGLLSGLLIKTRYTLYCRSDGCRVLLLCIQRHRALSFFPDLGQILASFIPDGLTILTKTGVVHVPDSLTLREADPSVDQIFRRLKAYYGDFDYGNVDDAIRKVCGLLWKEVEGQHGHKGWTVVPEWSVSSEKFTTPMRAVFTQADKARLRKLCTALDQEEFVTPIGIFRSLYAKVSASRR